MISLYGLAILLAGLQFVATNYGQKSLVLKVSKHSKGIFNCSEVAEPLGVRHLSGAGTELGCGRGHIHSRAGSGPNMVLIKTILADFLYGYNATGKESRVELLLYDDNLQRNTTHEANKDSPVTYATGRVMHAELFMNKTGVHLPAPDLMHMGKCRLTVTDDFMQTAVDAFAIILEGSIQDVLALPGDYVLRSARTISMMKIPLEKMSVMWDVVLNGRKADQISYETLEMYRPLFKYLNGKQIARLNLSNPEIVKYIGTHPQLNRRQMGVVAKRYIKTNPHWNESKHLSTMNNLLCGVPMSFMRKLDETVYLKLDHQVFYHIIACDPLQRRFYLNMMTRTQALGKSYSWSARDVSRLGLLMVEVEGPVLASVRPEAMAGLTAHVMAQLKPENMQYITDMQMQHINLQAKKILAKKLKRFQLEMIADKACLPARSDLILLLITLLASEYIK